MSKKNLLILSLIILGVVGYGIYSKKNQNPSSLIEGNQTASSNDILEKDGIDIKERISDPTEAEQFLAIKPSDVVLGNENAPVTIIEYSSLSCPHCKNFHEDVLPSIEETYVNTGKVKLIHRDYPIDPPSLAGATYLKCISKDKYYEQLKLLFDKQADWAYKSDYQEKLESVAKLDGMSLEEFNSCMANKSLEKEILESRAYADKFLKFNATPVYIINGKIYLGKKDKNFFFDRIEEALGNKPVSSDNTTPQENSPISVPTSTELPTIEGQTGHIDVETNIPTTIPSTSIPQPMEVPNTTPEPKVEEHTIQEPPQKIIDVEQSPPSSVVIHQETSGVNEKSTK
jgi:protein-disulfide isomerase